MEWGQFVTRPPVEAAGSALRELTDESLKRRKDYRVAVKWKGIFEAWLIFLGQPLRPVMQENTRIGARTSVVLRTCWIDRRTEETLGNMRFIDQGCETKEIHVGSPSSQGHSGLYRPNLKSRPGNWQKNSCFVLGPVPSRRIKIRPVSRDVDVFSEAGWALPAGPHFAKGGSMENRYKKRRNIVVPYYTRVGILLGTGTGTGAGWYSTGGDEFVSQRMYIVTIHAHRSERHIARGALRKGMVMSSAPTVSTFYYVTWAEPTTCMYPPCPCLRKIPFSKFFDLSSLSRRIL
ncbi:hypothetical protein V1478_009140, partial [Vespula squamosa]